MASLRRPRKRISTGISTPTCWILLLAKREAVEFFGDEGGSIINIGGSLASDLNPSNSAADTAAKGAADATTRVLAKELGARIICVNAVKPGMIKSKALTLAASSAAIPKKTRRTDAVRPNWTARR